MIPPPRASGAAGVAPRVRASATESGVPSPGADTESEDGADYGDEGISTALANPFDGGSALPPGDEDGPPLEALEAQMRGELAERDSAAAPPAARRRAATPSDEDDEPGAGKAKLPELDELVARIPPEVRETLDELFRARFVSVKKLPKQAFAAATRKRD